MRNTRLSGHGLNSEGAAYERGGYTGNAWVPARSWTGVALCECGETSPVLESNGARKRWHSDVHKPEMRRRIEAEG